MDVSPEALEAARLIDRLERLARLGEHARGLNPAQWDVLRYLARANRFSRTPAALAGYLGSTRGTVSRTIASLEAKGHVSREASASDGRSVVLALTLRGQQTLRRDPLFAVARDIEQTVGVGATDLLDGLRRILRQAIARNDGRAFGACVTCRHFRGSVRPSSRQPHHCGLLDEPLSEIDSLAICVEQQPVAA